MKPQTMTPQAIRPQTQTMKQSMPVIAGFSLLELMLSLVLVSILALIAVPSYQRYIERKDLAMAKQAALKIATELETFKARNFSYQGFDLGQLYPSYDATRQQLLLPIGADQARSKYVLHLVDLGSKSPLNNTGLNTTSPASLASQHSAVSTPIGLGWAISVVRAKTTSGEYLQPRNYDLLLNSTGLRCMTQRVNQVQGLQDCGDAESQAWD